MHQTPAALKNPLSIPSVLLTHDKLPNNFDEVEAEVMEQFWHCTSCNSTYHIDAFPRRYTRDGKLVVMKTCRVCRRKYFDKRPAARKARECIEDARNQPCADCGQRLPLACMQLVPPPDAPFNPVKEAGRCSLAKLQAVVKTCTVRCANCRAIREAERRQSRGKPSLKVTDAPMLRAVLSALSAPAHTSSRLAESTPDVSATSSAPLTEAQSLGDERVGEHTNERSSS